MAIHLPKKEIWQENLRAMKSDEVLAAVVFAHRSRRSMETLLWQVSKYKTRMPALLFTLQAFPDAA